MLCQMVTDVVLLLERNLEEDNNLFDSIHFWLKGLYPVVCIDLSCFYSETIIDGVCAAGFCTLDRTVEK